MKFGQFVLGVLILAAIFLLYTQKSWVPKLINGVGSSEDTLINLQNPSRAYSSRVIYDCDNGRGIEATFYKDGDRKVVLTFDGKNSIELLPTATPNGQRYSNSNGSLVLYLPSATDALVFENGEEVNYTGCKKFSNG